MQPQISSGVSKDDPNSLYLLANHLYYDDRFDNPSMEGMRKGALKNAKKAADQGHWEAKMLYEQIIREYPELKDV